VVARRRARQARALGLSPSDRRKSRNLRASAEPAESVAGLGARRTAVALLRQVVERRVPLDVLLDEAHGNAHFRALDARDRSLVRAIVGIALRRRGEIHTAIAARLDRPLPEGAGELSAILSVGATQILYLDIPDHAAVNIAVAQAAAGRDTRAARGLVNGVLRRIAREREDILAQTAPGRANTPDWLFQRWVAAYGDTTAEAIANAHLAPPALDLSVKAEPVYWAERLGGVLLPTGTIRLADAGRVSELPGYAEGAWWVQDAAAALPARLLGDVAGKYVVDLCAAPGGKTAELAAAGAIVTAVDISASRLRRLAANLERLGLTARLEPVDLLAWSPDRRFDGVLLDAPCTATGTIRRHPDILWLKRPNDVPVLADLQAKMLDRAAALVAPAGLLVFCTCSLEPEEGEAQVAPFLARHPEFSLIPIGADELAGLTHLVTPAGMLRTLPCHGFGPTPAFQGMDGFFAARFRRA
jgi:16S rRNA (cytosine967-C5)-methyltransferase